MAGLIKRGNVWVATFYDAHGKEVRKSTKTKVRFKGTTPREQKRLAQTIADRMEDVSRGKIQGSLAVEAVQSLVNATMGGKPDIPTVSEYLSSLTPAGKEQNQRNARRAYRLFLDFLGMEASIRLDMVKPSACERFLGSMLQKVSSGTAELYRFHLSAAYNIAIRKGIIAANPWQHIRMNAILDRYAPMSKGDTVKRVPFTAAEMNIILTKFPQPWQDLAALSYFTAQRVGDCCLLTWDRVDMKGGIIHFLTQKTGEALDQPIIQALRIRLERLQAEASGASDDYLFPDLAAMYKRSNGSVGSKFNTLLDVFGLRTPMDKVTGKSGRSVSTKTFHSIRHTAVTIMRDSNKVTPDQCRAVVGHSETVERGYYTARMEKKEEALSVLSAAVEDI